MIIFVDSATKIYPKQYDGSKRKTQAIFFANRWQFLSSIRRTMIIAGNIPANRKFVKKCIAMAFSWLL